MSQTTGSITIPSQLQAPPRAQTVAQRRAQRIVKPTPQVTVPTEIAPQPGVAPKQDKSWQGLQIMLSRGKFKPGFGQKAKDMYRSIIEPTDNTLDLMLKQGKVSRAEHKQLQSIRHNYQAGVAAHYQAGSWSAPTTHLPEKVITVGGKQFPVGEAIVIKDGVVTIGGRTPQQFMAERKIDVTTPTVTIGGRTPQQFMAERKIDVTTPPPLSIGLPPDEPISKVPKTVIGRVETWMAERPRQELPYGLEPTPARRLGEEFSLRYAHMWAGRKIVESPWGEKIISRVEERFPKVTKLYPSAPYVSPFVEELPTFTFFSPALSTGTYKQTTIQKELSKSKFEKLSKYFDKTAKDLLKKKDWKAQTKYLTNLAKQYKNDPKKLADFQRVVQELYAKGFYKGVPLDVLTTQTPAMAKETGVDVIYQLLGQAPTMKGVGITGSTVSGFSIKPERFREIPLVEEEPLITKTHEELTTFGLGRVDTFKLKQVPKLEEKQKLKLKQPQLEGFIQKIVPRTAQPSLQVLATTPAQVTLTKQVPRQVPKMRAPSSPIFRSPIRPGEALPIIPLPFVRKPDPRKAERTGYQTYVKVGGKFKKVSDKPLTRSGAKDIGARYTDNTTSATFKIEPIKQTKVVQGKKMTSLKKFEEGELEKGTNYFSQTAGKFRQFMIKRGKKLLMQDKWIEHRNKRSDTIGEKQGLTVAQFKARETKRRAGLPVRKSKKRKAPTNVKGFFGMR